MAYLNSADLDQTAPEEGAVWSVSMLFASCPVVQSIVSLTSLLVVKISTVLGIFAEKMWGLLTFFQQKYLQICHINDQSFNDTLTNDIVSFGQLGPDIGW